ncbi:Translin [Limtongia smithiae]|uniref:Translin n=1 Tax=Limtongia smithiae TaxID=1125753 RepID=UPI0034CE3922
MDQSVVVAVDLDVFTRCQDALDRDAEIREVRALYCAIQQDQALTLAGPSHIDKSSRATYAVSALDSVHCSFYPGFGMYVPNSDQPLQATNAIAVGRFQDQTKQSFHLQREAIKALGRVASQHPFYKYNQIWSRALQSAAFAALLRDWLVTEGRTHADGKLTTIEAVCAELGVDPNPMGQDRFHLALEEYLQATISLINELSRLAVNSVIMAEGGDYSTPVRINYFIKQLQAGFLMLNLKNDSLRSRVDSIKYDVKKVEEVIYDLSLRGLIKH